MYGNQEGLAACINCTAGSYSDTELGARFCTNCPKGTYNEDGKTVTYSNPPQCIKCPQGKYQDATGADTKMTAKNVKGFHSINILANQGAISARKHSIKAVPRARAVTQVNTSMAILAQYVRWASTRRVELNPSVRHVRLATMAKI
jgi:hypothetical protein